MELAVIGPGTMGLAAAARLVDTGLVQAPHVRLSRVRPTRKESIGKRLPEARALEDNAGAVSGADVVVIAVKPVQFASVAGELQGKIPDKAVVISLMTGVALDTLSGGLGTSKIVRASTNIGIERGLGTTFWSGTADIGETEKNIARRVFSAWGDDVELNSESLLNLAMVGVGSGPAIVIDFIQGLVHALVTEGMPPAMAEKGVLSLVRGTAELASGKSRSLAEFKQSVVTPGGITAEALLAMDEGRFRATLVHAVRRAHEKAGRLT
jgi:pyrroline-5-carboxylate reductase